MFFIRKPKCLVKKGSFIVKDQKKTIGHGCPLVGMNTPLISKEDRMILTGG